MCLILFAYQMHPSHPLIVAANRDEFYARPATSLQFWPEAPHILAGQDLSAGGTWMGANTRGRFAAVTNFAEPLPNPAAQPTPVPPNSRGALVQGFLSGNQSARDYAQGIEGSLYRGYSLLLFDGQDLLCASNRYDNQTLVPGIYGLSNDALGVPWPKVVKGTARLQNLIARAELKTNALIELVADRQAPADDELPHRGQSRDIERRVAPCFIVGEDYGTRASTALLLGNQGLEIAEQTYLTGGQADRLVHIHLPSFTV